MKIAVTGSAGFIGQAVMNHPLAQKHEMVGADRRHGVNILNPVMLDGALAGCDAVIHLAGVLGTAELFDSIGTAIEVNIHGTNNVLDAAVRNDLRYVGITMPDVWPSVYQATKLAATRLAEAYHHHAGIPVTHIRAFNAFGVGQAHGPGHPQKIVPTFATASWLGNPMPIWGDGNQTVDLVHVDDIAARLLTAATAKGDAAFGHGEIWDAGSGIEISVNQVAAAVGSITGHYEPVYLPMRAGELEDTKLRATNFGPFSPGRLNFVLSMDDRFREAVESYKP